MGSEKSRRPAPRRRGATALLVALLISIVLGLLAFAIDTGYIVLVRTELQRAADSAAMAAAATMRLPRSEMEAFAQEHAGPRDMSSADQKLCLSPHEIEYGSWDVSTRTFKPSPEPGNAVRVTARADASAIANSPLFFGHIYKRFSFSYQASAVAVANPRDICFVVDLSGSMNDNTEPCWATQEIDATFGPQGFPNCGTHLMPALYEDLGFGSFPGELEYLGAPWGVPQNRNAYAALTKDGGPLTGVSVPSECRITSTDDEATRKRKAYSIIIERQIARLMPNAKPAPSMANYVYWEKYIDYLILPLSRDAGKRITSDRGTIPPNRTSGRIDSFNNPNTSTFPNATKSVPRSFCNRIGYRTYVQFLLDHGRDLKPDGVNYVPLSVNSPLCPRHDEATAGGTLSFPPRDEPTHAMRRAMIAAMTIVRDANLSIADSGERDRVSIVTFDSLSNGGPVVLQKLTSDYDDAMQACTQLQACGDTDATNAMEAGLIAARNLIKKRSEGGQGRESTDKVVVLLTQGIANLYASSNTTVDQWIASSKHKSEYYGNGAYCLDAPLMQVEQMQAMRWYVFPVGIGLGCDFDFMDRLARLGGTADGHGKGPRDSGNPAQREEWLGQILKEIVSSPEVRLVQ